MGIDVHNHGCLGFDFSIATVLEIQKMQEYYGKTTVVSIAHTKCDYDLAMKAIDEEWNLNEVMINGFKFGKHVEKRGSLLRAVLFLLICKNNLFFRGEVVLIEIQGKIWYNKQDKNC